MSWFWWVMLACIMDRTGQSASERMRRELADHGTRIVNIEAQFIQVEARVNQLEDLTRTRGQVDIMKMESLDELRTELSRVRGEVEVLSHQVGEGGKELQDRTEDAAYRVQWLEGRATQLEQALGLKPPPPPAILPSPGPEEGEGTLSPEGGTGEAGTPPGEGETAPVVAAAGTADPAAGGTTPDPDKMVDGAKGLLDAGNTDAAEQMLERFLQLHPGHKREGEARYRRANAAQKAGKYQQGVLRYQEVIDKHKMSAWASWAMFKQGECFALQGQMGNARVFFNEVLRIFPGTPAAAEAKKRLKK
jgi:TolA-binding protein